ncbi:MAG TPA: lysine--tRNA ligase [Thermoplasmataceae archaeon]|nr:lysine--tRNA ligase [Thermoplasmataceae archaeon]
MHWADAFAASLDGPQLVSTGISPSGPIHVGNMREILTGDMIFKAIRSRGMNARFIYLCDDMDPLRKVYPFLGQEYASHVGKPLCAIPAPSGNVTYSEYFLAPLIDVFGKIDVQIEVIRTSKLYEEGVFSKAIDIVFRNSEKIRNILEEVSGREIKGEWAPYNPICGQCGRISSTHVVSYTYPYVEYTCSYGHAGRADVRKADGKMPWRIEWPAKWFALGVTVEPFGKDHGAAGGSYDTGKRIAEEVFGIRAPSYLMYERILLKGKGAMHSSTGLAIAASDMVEFAPPEILRFIIARVNPSRHIDFDPSLGLLNMIDEYERYRQAYYGLEKVQDHEDARRIYELSRINQNEGPVKVSYRHLIMLAQIYKTSEALLAALRRSGLSENDIPSDIREKIRVMRNWIERYAPDSVKFSLVESGYTGQPLDLKQREILRMFLERMGRIAWEPDAIHNEVHEIVKQAGADPGTGFAAFYNVLIGKDRGPRLGYFLSSLDRNFVRRRIDDAISLAPGTRATGS